MNVPKIIALIMVTCMFDNAFSQTQVIKGFVKDEHTNLVVSRASILNQKDQKRYVCNSFGAFTIAGHIDDTILITAIGYQPLFVIINSDHFKKVQHWQLSQVIYPLKTFLLPYKKTDSSGFYAKLIKTNALLNNYNNIFNRQKGPLLKYLPLLIVFGGCQGCITSLWEKYSQRGKELNKFERVYVLYLEQMKVDEKFTSEWFNKITGINSEDARHLYKTCRPTNDFILKNNEYDIAVFVRNCLKKQSPFLKRDSIKK